MRIIRRTLVALVLTATSRQLAAQVAPVEADAGYHIAATLAVPSSGSSLRLELLEDARPPLRPAIVRLVQAQGTEIGRLVLERPTAELTRVAVSQRDSVFAVRVDLSADAGSYNGPLVRFLDADSAHLGWTQVIDDSTHRSSELDLPLTLKTGWRALTSAPHPEILLVACRPDLDQPATTRDDVHFTITYSRFYVADGRWHRVSRRARGCWEDDDPFPPRSLFR